MRSLNTPVSFLEGLGVVAALLFVIYLLAVMFAHLRLLLMPRVLLG